MRELQLLLLLLLLPQLLPLQLLPLLDLGQEARLIRSFGVTSKPNRCVARDEDSEHLALRGSLGDVGSQQHIHFGPSISLVRPSPEDLDGCEES